MRDALTTASYGHDPRERFAVLEAGLQFLDLADGVGVEEAPRFVSLTLDQPEEVEFRAIDATAAFDGGPYPAHVLMHARDNLEVLLRDRWYSSGVALDGVPGSVEGLSSPWPVPWGVQWVYCPDDVPARLVRCRVTRGAVAFEGGGSTGQVAVRLCLTSVAPDGRAYPPPASPDHPDWIPLYVDSADPVVVDVPLHGRQLCGPGWVGAALWTWSEVGVQLSSGSITGASYPFVIELDSTAYTTGVPHLAVKINDAWIATSKALSGATDGVVAGVGYLRAPLGATNPAEVACLPPPHRWPQDVTGQEAYALHALGYVQVYGFALDVLPAGPRVADRDSFASNSRCKGPIDMGLVGAATRIVRTRVPTYGAHPVIPRGASPWLGVWLGDDMDGGRITDNVYKPVARCIAPERIPDHVGYTAICSLQRMAFQDSPSPVDFKARLIAYPVNSAVPLAYQSWQSLRWAEWSHPEDDFAGIVNWSGVCAQFTAQRRFSDWQWRWMGSLMGKRGGPVEWMEELLLTRHFVLHWVTPTDQLASASYPIELRLEIQLDGRDVECAVFCAGANIASLPRDVAI